MGGWPEAAGSLWGVEWAQSGDNGWVLDKCWKDSLRSGMLDSLWGCVSGFFHSQS